GLANGAEQVKHVVGDHFHLGRPAGCTRRLHALLAIRHRFLFCWGYTTDGTIQQNYLHNKTACVSQAVPRGDDCLPPSGDLVSTTDARSNGHILKALAGLLLALFVSTLSSTVVAT